jgi:hypothetical protein
MRKFNRKDSKAQQPERGAGAPLSNSEPIQLELFEQWTGDKLAQETPYEVKPSRDFILPPASTLAAEPRPTDSSQASANPASASPSRKEAGND